MHTEDLCEPLLYGLDPMDEPPNMNKVVAEPHATNDFNDARLSTVAWWRTHYGHLRGATSRLGLSADAAHEMVGLFTAAMLDALNIYRPHVSEELAAAVFSGFGASLAETAALPTDHHVIVDTARSSRKSSDQSSVLSTDQSQTSPEPEDASNQLEACTADASWCSKPIRKTVKLEDWARDKMLTEFCWSAYSLLTDGWSFEFRGVDVPGVAHLFSTRVAIVLIAHPARFLPDDEKLQDAVRKQAVSFLITVACKAFPDYSFKCSDLLPVLDEMDRLCQSTYWKNLSRKGEGALDGALRQKRLRARKKDPTIPLLRTKTERRKRSAHDLLCEALEARFKTQRQRLGEAEPEDSLSSTQLFGPQAAPEERGPEEEPVFDPQVESIFQLLLSHTQHEPDLLFEAGPSTRPATPPLLDDAALRQDFLRNKTKYKMVKLDEWYMYSKHKDMIDETLSRLLDGWAYTFNGVDVPARLDSLERRVSLAIFANLPHLAHESLDLIATARRKMIGLISHVMADAFPDLKFKRRDVIPVLDELNRLCRTTYFTCLTNSGDGAIDSALRQKRRRLRKKLERADDPPSADRRAEAGL